MSSAICFDCDRSKILSFGNGSTAAQKSPFFQEEGVHNVQKGDDAVYHSSFSISRDLFPYSWSFRYVILW